MSNVRLCLVKLEPGSLKIRSNPNRGFGRQIFDLLFTVYILIDVKDSAHDEKIIEFAFDAEFKVSTKKYYLADAEYALAS